MSILVFAEHDNGTFKKSSYEALTYAQDLAAAKNLTVTALAIGSVSNLNELGNHGANSVINIKGNNLDIFSDSNFIAKSSP